MRKDMIRLIVAAAAGTGLSVPASAQDQSGFCQSGFVLADLDGNGIFALSEIESMRAHEFGALDADADGTVTLEEYSGCQMLQAPSGEAPPRNVSATGSGELDGSGVQVELEALSDGVLTPQEYMEAAQSAFDATGNEEDNQLEWARAFVYLLPDETDTDVRAMSHDEYAARAVAMFRQLDADGNSELTPEEWVGEAADGSDAAAKTETEFQGLDADASGGVTLVEYSSAGAERAARARDAAIAGGWVEHGDGDSSGGLDEPAEGAEGEVVATGSEGLVGEGESLSGDGGDTGTEAAAAADGSGESGDAATAETDQPAADAPSGTEGGVPVFVYRFGLGD